MKLNSKPYRQFTLLIIIATSLAFASNVFIQSYTSSILAALSTKMIASTNGHYPPNIVIASFLTAFVTIGVDVWFYYHAGHLLKIPNKLVKSLVLAAIILEIKGELIRYTIVGYLDLVRLGAQHPSLYIILTQLDKWVPNLILAFLLVYFCPTKTQIEETVNSN